MLKTSRVSNWLFPKHTNVAWIIKCNNTLVKDPRLSIDSLHNWITPNLCKADGRSIILLLWKAIALLVQYLGKYCNLIRMHGSRRRLCVRWWIRFRHDWGSRWVIYYRSGKVACRIGSRSPTGSPKYANGDMVMFLHDISKYVIVRRSGAQRGWFIPDLGKALICKNLWILFLHDANNVYNLRHWLAFLSSWFDVLVLCIFRKIDSLWSTLYNSLVKYDSVFKKYADFKWLQFSYKSPYNVT